MQQNFPPATMWFRGSFSLGRKLSLRVSKSTPPRPERDQMWCILLSQGPLYTSMKLKNKSFRWYIVGINWSTCQEYGLVCHKSSNEKDFQFVWRIWIKLNYWHLTHFKNGMRQYWTSSSTGIEVISLFWQEIFCSCRNGSGNTDLKCMWKFQRWSPLQLRTSRQQLNW